MQDPNRRLPTRENYYWYARNSGSSHEEALRFADNSIRVGPAPSVEPQRPATPPRQPSALGGITRALTQGATRDVAASYAGGASWLTGGGDSAIGRYLERAEQNIEGDYEPQTGAERAARVVGRIGGEIGTAIALGGGLVRAATAVPQLSRVASALQSTSRLKRGAAYAATQAPLDVLMGSRDETPLLLPESFGRPGAMAENVALTGVAGALFAPVRQARAGRQAADEAAAGARPAADAAAPPPAAAQPAPAGRPRPAPAPEVQAPPAAARAPRAAAVEDVAQNVQGLLEGPLATFRGKEGVLRFGFEDTADGAAWILARGGKQTRGRAQAQRYLESLGLSEDQIKQYASNVGKSLRREAKEFAFDPAERGQTVFYYVPKIGSPSVPAAAAGPVAPVRPVRTVEEVVPQARPVGTAGYQAGLDEAETAFRALGGPDVRRLADERVVAEESAKASRAARYAEARAVSKQASERARQLQLPQSAADLPLKVGDNDLTFYSKLEKAAYIIAAGKNEVDPKIASAVKKVLAQAGYDPKEILEYGKDVVKTSKQMASALPKGSSEALNIKPGDVISARPFPVDLKASVGAPEIASGVAGAALGALAGATTPSDEDTQYAIPGAILGGALGGAFGRQAGRQIASDAGIIARGERRAPRADRFIEEATRREGTAAGLRSSVAANVSRFRYNVVEETHPVLLLAKKTLGNKAARKLDGMIARFAGAGQESMQYMRDNYDEFFRRFTEEQRRQIADFAVDRRAWESGLSIGKTPEALAQSYEAGMANPVLREGSDMLMGYFRRLLDMRYRAGLIPDADYQRILQSDDYYVPFAAEFAAESRRKAAKQAAGWNVRETGVGRMDREAIRDWQIQDPLEVLVEATVAAHRDVAKKRAFNIIARAIDKAAVDLEQGRSQIGKFIYRVDPSSRSKFEANRFNAINKRGERVTYEVRDEELFQAIAQQNKMSQNFAIEMLRDLARFKRAAIVLEPSFSLMQSIRDVPFYVAQRQDFQRGIREAGMGAAAGALAGSATEEDNMLAGALIGIGLGASARPVVELMGSLKNILGNDETYRQWLRMGGSSEGLRVRDPKDAREILRRLAADGVDLRDVVTPKRWVDALSFIAGAGEQMPRLAKYKELVARGVDPSVAIRDSQAVTVRFASKGASPLLKEINAITPFFNAKIQGWDKLVQMAKDPKQRVMAGMVLLAPTVGLFMINKDNPEYWDRPQWEKDNFWLVPKPEGGFYRVPKPFELGYAFASIPERYMSFLAETGEMESAAPRRNVTGAQALARGAGTFLLDPVQQTAPMPTALEIPLSQAMNYDFFRRRQLVPQYYERIQSGEQALPYTGALPRFIGRATQVGGLPGISPVRAEKFLTDIGGTGYRRLSEGVLDPAFRSAGMDAPVQRARDMGLGPELTRLTGLSRFVTRDYDATQVETDARDRLRKLDTVNQTLQMKINQRRPVEEIRAYRERHREELAARARLNDLRIRLDRITAERRDIMRRTDITPEQRDARMERLKSQADLISRRVVEYGAR